MHDVPSFLQRILWGIVAIVLVFLAFGSSLKHGFSMLDDSYLVVNNLTAHGLSFEHLKAAFTTFDPELYIPVTLLSFQLNYALSGLQPGIYHATNVLLHILNVFLILWISWILLQKRTWLPILVGSLFAVHPLHTEAVAWIAGRKDLLAVTFALSSTLLFLRAEAGKRRFYFASIVLFLLGLLSKVSIALLPCMLLIVVFLQEKPLKPFVRSLVPFFALSITFILIAFLGKERLLSDVGILELLLLAGRSTVFYLEKILIPTNLSVFYPFSQSISLSTPSIFWSWIIVGFITIVVILLRKHARWPLAMWLLFLLSIAPTFLNAVKGETVFFAVDRYAYLASLWIFVLVAWCIGILSTKIRSKFQWIFTVALGTVIIVLLVLSQKQTKVWASDEALYGNALKQYPASREARLGLSIVYRESGRFAEEEKVLQDGMQYESYPGYLTGLGSLAARRGDTAQALNFYNQAKRVAPKNPEAFFFEAVLLESQGKLKEALQSYDQAISLDETYVSTLINRGSLKLDQGDSLAAEKDFRSALKWNPNTLEAHYNLFLLLEQAKNNDAAFLHLQKAFELDPKNSEIVLAYAYRVMERGQYIDARDALMSLLKSDSENRSAKRLLEYMVERGFFSRDEAFGSIIKSKK